MNSATVLEMKSGPHILIRIVWYFVAGWWVTAIAMAVAWVAGILIIGLPLTFWLVNRIPTTLTLRPRREQYLLVTDPDGVTRMRKLSTEQTSLPLRIVYYFLVGWWLSLLWIIVSYLFMLTIIGIPVGMLMVNRLPFVFSLHRGYA